MKRLLALQQSGEGARPRKLGRSLAEGAAKIKVLQGGYRAKVEIEGQVFSVGELRSLLQKSVRLSIEPYLQVVLASFQALIRSETDTRNFTNFLNRLLIILLEDIFPVDQEQLGELAMLAARLVNCKKALLSSDRARALDLLDGVCAQFGAVSQREHGFGHSRDVSALRSAMLEALAQRAPGETRAALGVIQQDLGLNRDIEPLVRHLFQPETSTKGLRYKNKTLELWQALGLEQASLYKEVYSVVLHSHREFFWPVLASMLQPQPEESWRGCVAQRLREFEELNGEPYPLYQEEGSADLRDFFRRRAADHHTGSAKKNSPVANERFLRVSIAHSPHKFFMRLPARYLANYFRSKRASSMSALPPSKIPAAPSEQANSLSQQQKLALRALEQSVQRGRPAWVLVGLAQLPCGGKPASAIFSLGGQSPAAAKEYFFAKGPFSGPEPVAFQLEAERLKKHLWPDYSPISYEPEGRFLYQRALGCDPYSLQGDFAVSASVGKVQQADLQKCPELCQQVLKLLVMRFLLQASDSHLRNLLWDSKQKQAYSVDEMTFKARALPGVEDLSEMQWLFSKPAAQPVRQFLCQCLTKQPDLIVDFVRRFPESPRRDGLVQAILAFAPSPARTNGML